MRISIIGAGFAGSEAALTLSDAGYDTDLYEMRPDIMPEPFAGESGFAYPLCSNSLKSYQLRNAHGVLKAELMILGSRLLRIAHRCRIPAGRSLAVDRKLFTDAVTEEVESRSNIHIIRKECDPALIEGPVILATGPLSSDKVTAFLSKYTDFLYFYDAVSPIVTAESIDMNICFRQSRYNTGSDYLNCPMSREQYDSFYEALVNAETVPAARFEKMNLFSGCMPVESIASTGYKSLLFGPMKPVGLDGNHHAVVQLRQENREGTLYNLVGFQTRMKFPEQKRIIRMIPGLENADIVRYGVIHRNIYTDSPSILDNRMRILNTDIFLAGQLMGSEGYVEAIGTGRIAALSLIARMENRAFSLPPASTVIGGLLNYILNNETPINPMNANFGLVEGYDKRKKDAVARKCLNDIIEWKNEQIH